MPLTAFMHSTVSTVLCSYAGLCYIAQAPILLRNVTVLCTQVSKKKREQTNEGTEHTTSVIKRWKQEKDKHSMRNEKCRKEERV